VALKVIVGGVLSTRHRTGQLMDGLAGSLDVTVSVALYHFSVGAPVQTTYRILTPFTPIDVGKLYDLASTSGYGSVWRSEKTDASAPEKLAPVKVRGSEPSLPIVIVLKVLPPV